MTNMEAVETMVLKDNSEMQVILNKGILDKAFSVKVINKKTRKRITYRNKKIMLNLISKCIRESNEEEIKW